MLIQQEIKFQIALPILKARDSYNLFPLGDGTGGQVQGYKWEKLSNSFYYPCGSWVGGTKSAEEKLGLSNEKINTTCMTELKVSKEGLLSTTNLQRGQKMHHPQTSVN